MTKSESTKSRTGAGNASPERVRHADSKSGWLRALTGHKYSLLFGLLHPRTHQAKSTTKLNRYPEIFAAATKAAPSARKILSFGCSTGEECVTLASYFPTAQIIGADINVLNLLRTFRYRSERVRFVYASDRILNRFGSFDAIFCMAVLRFSGRYQAAYPFERFAERVHYLEGLVRPGGLLVIHNSTYRFVDTTHRYDYETIPVTVHHDKVYLPDGTTETQPEGIIFRRLDY